MGDARSGSRRPRERPDLARDGGTGREAARVDAGACPVRLLPPHQAAWIPAGLHHQTTLNAGVQTLAVLFEPGIVAAVPAHLQSEWQTAQTQSARGSLDCLQALAEQKLPLLTTAMNTLNAAAADEDSLFTHLIAEIKNVCRACV